MRHLLLAELICTVLNGVHHGEGLSGKGIGRWRGGKIRRVEGAECPKCGVAEQTPDNIEFRCGMVRRVRDERGRRE